MLKNYFKIAVRNILRHKAYSLINILGLSIGVACCLLLALYIQEEYAVDKHHDRVEDVYRITTVFQNIDNIRELASCSPPLAMAMKDEIPEVEVAARLLNPPGLSQNLIRYETNMFYESDGFIGDSTIFSIFSYDFLAGNPDKALTEPNSVVLTEELAKKIFGKEPALNKVISIDQGGATADFRVTAVIRQKGKSHQNPHFITSTAGGGWADYLKQPEVADEWGGQNFIPSYVKLAPGHNKDEVIRKMNEVLIKHGAEDMKALGMSKKLSLEPVKDIHLYSGIGQSPRITYIYVIAAIATFILLIACINFMNLSTAKAAKRAGEIGVRKAMGAYRSSLVSQIMGEAMIIVAISMIISVGIMQLALPMFNTLTGKTISFGSDNMLYFGGALLAITVITGLIAGSYPAFYLSSFKPAEVLKGKGKTGNTSGILRQALVVFQFIIGITLICGMLMINKQLKFMSNSNLGFNPDAKIVIPLRTGTAQQNAPALQQELGKLASVEAVSSSNYVPGSPIFSDFRLYKKGESMENGILHRMNYIDYGYIEMMGIKIIAGRSFGVTEDSTTNNIIINRQGIEELKLTPEDAIGAELAMDWQGRHLTFRIVGVMENYHQVSLKEKIVPTAFFKKGKDQTLDNVVVKLSTGDMLNTLAQVEEKWKAVNPDTPFEFMFLDERVQKQYAEDVRVGQIITVFTVIAIVISCLGLYGLSTFMAEQRFKEIGVRKVLGANVGQIVALMSKEFVRLIIIAFAISVPLGIYSMDKWLQGFEYKTSIDVLIFVYAGLAALLIALVTVSFESFKAASTNPVKALRTE
ncbi:MAG: ABC transporter permease [Cyclobacteriaceae bacterium]|nr:ABC transporter permease [Cyclobacteriaceae bacterium]